MRTRAMLFLAVSSLIIGLAAPASSQSTEKDAHGVVGVLDPQTGAFTPMPRDSADAAAIALLTNSTGTLLFKFTLTVKSPVPTNGKISCNAQATVFETTSGQNIFEQGSAFATLTSGVWSCTVSIPYSWPLASPTTDMVQLSYNVGIGEGYQITATNSAATAVILLGPRNTQKTIGSIKVPANGATTTELVSVTL